MKRFVYLQIQSEKMLLLLNVSPSADTATVSKSTTTNQLCIWSPPKTNLDPENGLPKKRPRNKWFGFWKKIVILVEVFVIVVGLGLLDFVVWFFLPATQSQLTTTVSPKPATFIITPTTVIPVGNSSTTTSTDDGYRLIIYKEVFHNLFSQKPQRIRYLYGLSSLQGRFVW
jgi:hypothetical protein